MTSLAVTSFLRATLLFLTAIQIHWSARATEPEIWLAPEDSIKRAQRGEPPGDFMDLFPPDAPWAKAASHVQVFEIYPQFLARSSDEELRAVIDGLKRRKIALAISYGMLHRPKGAEMHEGYGAELAERDIAKLQRLGADVRYVVADEPLLFGHFFWGVGAPPLPIPDLARDFVSTARLFRAAFPKVRFGMDDPIMLYKDEEWAPAMREFLDAYQKEFGERMGFVRLECASFQIHEWQPRYLAAAELFHAAGVDFGTLVTGDATDPSDAQWVARAEERYVAWESWDRPAPAQVVFQSWMPRPSHNLPETAPDTLPHLLNGYFRERTKLTTGQDPEHVLARLSGANLRPLGGAPVTVSILPGFDDPAMVHRMIKGTVPAEARFVQVGLRIGLESSRAGLAGLTLESPHYCEAGAGGEAATFEIVPGLKGWGTKGDAKWETVGDAAATKVEITAATGQTLLLNSKLTAATPDRDFRVEFNVHVHPDTQTGYLIVFFFDASKKVIQHLTEPLVPENPRVIQSLVTDADGKVNVSLLSPEIRSARELRLRYPGDDHLRPAFATIFPEP